MSFWFWGNQRILPTRSGNIILLVELSNLTVWLLGFFPILCLVKKTHFLIHLSLGRRGLRHLYPVCQGEVQDILAVVHQGGHCPNSLSPPSWLFFFKITSCSFLMGILPDIPWQLNPFVNLDTHHWAALGVNGLLEIAWSLKIQVCQDINFMILKQNLKGFKTNCSIWQQNEKRQVDNCITGIWHLNWRLCNIVSVLHSFPKIFVMNDYNPPVFIWNIEMFSIV